MQEIFKIGVVLKPQGVRGELKVQSLSGDINRFKNLKEVIIDDATYRILKTKIVSDTVFVALDGVFDRNAAEGFRGKFLCVKRENAIELKNGEYFIADLLGATVWDENGRIGRVTDITNAKTDIFTVLSDSGKVLRFPFLKDLLYSVDAKKGEIKVKGKRLSEVGVYED